MIILREIVRSLAAPVTVLKVVASNYRDALILGVPIEEFLTKRKKIWVRYTIVLQDYCALYVLKHPIKAAADTML
tara:strand:+ start:20161 stop:20385 length:225 start_codon:yes stop_codon:yes gene_type:complete